MAAWLWENLTRSERAAYSSVWGALRQGITATAALRSYRAAGGSIRTQSWYSLFAASRDVWRQMAGLSGLLPHQKWAASELPEALSKLTRRYSYSVLMHGVEPRHTGDEGYYVTVSSSRLLSREEAEATALEAISEYAEAGFREWARPELISGLRSGAEGFLL